LHNLHFTRHAIQRIHQRALSEADIEYVVEHGRRHWAGGVLHCFLGRRDIPGQDRRMDRIWRLEGTTVLLKEINEQTAMVVTAYRNRKASRQFRRKAKFNFKQVV
jgi:hypothetical protein